VHEKLDDWRETFRRRAGAAQATNLLVFGAVDDLWVSPERGSHRRRLQGDRKDREVSIDSDWQISYKRQMEVYQWLLRQNGLPVSSTGYFVYTNGRMDLDGFFNKIEFKTKLIPYTGRRQLGRTDATQDEKMHGQR
jgi:hypothetical protein